MNVKYKTGHNGKLYLSGVALASMACQFSPLSLRNSHHLEMTDTETKLYNVFLGAVL